MTLPRAPRTAITAMIVACVLVTAAMVALDLVVARVAEQIILDAAAQRLRATALLAASQVRGEDLAAVDSPDDVFQPAFRRVHSTLMRVRSVDPEIVYVYTLVYSGDGDDWVTLVDADFFALDMDNDGSLSAAEEGSPPGWVYHAGADHPALLQGQSRSATDMIPEETPPWGITASGFAPVYDDKGRFVAVLGVDVMHEQVLGRVRSAKAAVAGLSLLIGLMLLYTFSVYWRRNTVRTNEAQLQAQLAEVKALFAKFVPENVRRELERNPDVSSLERKEADVTVMFVDLEGYTRMSERLAGESIGKLLERYFSRFLEIIQQHRGQVNETAGDGLMVLFEQNAPLGHALDALESAMGIERAAAEINASLGPEDEPVAVNIGINSGKAFVGLNRFRSVTGERYTYTATGPTTNIAARVAGLAKGGDILVSEATYERVREHVDMERVGRRSLKNVSRPIMLYRPRGAGRSGRVDPLVAAEDAENLAP